MKYIRTEDNLYEIESTFVDYKGKTIYQTVKNGIIDETEIVKVGDKIEEVCDEIIFILEGSPIPYSAPYQYDRERKMEWFKIETEIDIGFGFTEKIKEKFLAIWTKGEHSEPILKTVAKLNKESVVLVLL